MFFWIGLIIFAYLFEKVCAYIVEQSKYKNMKVVQLKNGSIYDCGNDKKNPMLEDVMFDTGLSDEEMDERLPDYNMDLEDFD